MDDKEKKQVEVLIDTYKYKEALSLVNEILLKDPKNYDYLSTKVSILGLEGLYEEAVKVADLALQEKKDDYFLLYRKGVSLYYQKKYLEALNSFEKCLEKKPDFVQALGKKISCLIFSGKYQLAVDIFEESDLTEDIFNYQLNNIGFALLELGEYERSEKYLKAARRVESNIIVFNNIVELYRRKKNIAKFIIELLNANLKRIYCRYFYKGKNKKETFRTDLFIMPGKLFTVNPQIRETKAILKLFNSLHWSALCNDTFNWFDINIPLDVLNDNNYKGDIDIIVSMPKTFPPEKNTPAWYRSFEVKSILVEKTGKTRSLGVGKYNTIYKQLNKLKKFGCEQIILLEIYGLERGFSDKFNFPTKKIELEIINKVNLIKNDGFGYLVLPVEPSKTHPDEFGGKFYFPMNILVGKPNIVASPFSELVEHLKKFYKLEKSKHEIKGIPAIFYCKKCKKLILLGVSDENLVCYHCNQNILKCL